MKDGKSLTYFGVQWDISLEERWKSRKRGGALYYWDRQLLEEVATISVQASIHLFSEPIGGYSYGMNGEMCETHIFPMTIPGLQLQVINWANWWQMMGGADCGGVEYVWLLNHHPVETGR